MGLGFTVGWKRWALPIRSPLPTNSCSRQRPPPLKSRETTCESGRATPSLVLEESESLHRDAFKAYACSNGALHTIENTCANACWTEENIDKNFLRCYSQLNRPANTTEGSSAYLTSLKATNSLEFSLMMENLDKLEDIFAGADLVRLERDILQHIGRLGALKLFHACISRTLVEPAVQNRKFLVSNYFGDFSKDCLADENKGTAIIHTGRKYKRKLRRTRDSDKVDNIFTLSASKKKVDKIESSAVSLPTDFSDSMASSKSKRVLIARNESDMSRGVKEIAELERARTKLEEQLGRTATYARWAEAAGIDQKTLQQRLQYGWYCRDKLIRSTQSLVVYLARNYRGMGIAFDDLLQAGHVGVLQGAERFDNTRGYRFSTYVQYWIRKSILALISRNSRGIRIPVRMEKAIKQLKKAHRNFYNQVGRYPHDDEAAELTGIPLAKVRLARKCSRAIGSIDQEMGDGWSTKFMEVTPDASVRSPDEVVMSLHMRNDISKLLEGLRPREREVLILRYGLQDGRCKSLEEIGGLFYVSKEWIRQIEKAALTKIRRDGTQADLRYYLHL